MPSTPLTVLMVGAQWPPETFIERLALGLAASGVRVQIAATRRTDHTDTRPMPQGLEWIELPSWEEAVWRRAMTLVRLVLTKSVRYPTQVMGLARRLRRTAAAQERSFIKRWYRLLPFVGLQPGILHFQWNTAAIDYAELSDLFRKPTVVSCRGSQILVAPHHPDRREAIVTGLRATLNAASRVHCVSDDIRDKALTYGGHPETAVVIRPAVDTEVFSPGVPAPARQPGAALRVVSIGWLVWKKDHETALEAVSRLVASGVAVTVEICGEGPEREALAFTIQDLGLEEIVRLRGRLAPADCVDALRRADVCVLSSVAEGISNAVLEAMACGLPVVSTDCGGMREAVRDGVDGLIVPPRNPEALAEALTRLADDEALRQRMGANARERVLGHFTLDAQVQAFRQLYASAMSEAR